MKHGPEAMAQRDGSLNLWFCWPLGTSGPSTAWLVARSSGVSKPIEKPPQLQIIPLFVPNGCGPMEVTIGASAMPSRKAVQVPVSKRPVASPADAHAALLCCLTGQAVLSLRSQQHPPTLHHSPPCGSSSGPRPKPAALRPQGAAAIHRSCTLPLFTFLLSRPCFPGWVCLPPPLSLAAPEEGEALASVSICGVGMRLSGPGSTTWLEICMLR